MGGAISAQRTNSTGSSNNTPVTELTLPKAETKVDRQSENIPALSFRKELIPYLEKNYDKMLLLVLRPPQTLAGDSPSEQPAISNLGKSELGVLLCTIGKVEPGSPDEEPLLIRGQTVHQHMIKYNPMLSDQLFSARGPLAGQLQELGLSEIDPKSVRLVDPHSGLPYTLSTSQDKILLCGNSEGYEVLSVAECGNDQLRVDFAKHKDRLLQQMTPQSDMTEKIAALAYLMNDEQRQLALTYAIEPFSLKWSAEESGAQHGSFSPHIVGKFFAGRSQFRAYSYGMIDWPTKYVQDNKGKQCYTRGYASAVQSFYDDAKLPVMRHLLEREHSGIIERKTSRFELLRHNVTVEIPEDIGWVAGKAKTIMDDSTSAVTHTIDSTVTRGKETVVRQVRRTVIETVNDGARRIFNRLIDSLTPRIF